MKIKNNLIYSMVILLIIFTSLGILSLYLDIQLANISEYHEKMSIPALSSLEKISTISEKILTNVHGFALSHEHAYSEYLFNSEQLLVEINHYDELTYAKNSLNEELAHPMMQNQMQGFVSEMRIWNDKQERLSQEIFLLNEKGDAKPEKMIQIFDELDTEMINFRNVMMEAKNMEQKGKDEKQEEIFSIIFFNQIIFFLTIFLGITVTVSIVYFNKKLIKSEKLLSIGKLSSTLAHNIQNPLSSLKQSLEIIKRKSYNDEITKNEVERANRVINRIELQVNDVLTYAKKPPLITNESSVLTILKKSLDIISIPKQITLEISKKDIDVKWDENKIIVLFMNILLNAIQAIGDKEGKISVRIFNENDNVIIEFENSGPNIPEENLEKIFDPLYTTKMIGTGLGLSSCRNIIDLHKGDIKVSNNPVKFIIKIRRIL